MSVLLRFRWGLGAFQTTWGRVRKTAEERNVAFAPSSGPSED
jgi:hypothetical protein